MSASALGSLNAAHASATARANAAPNSMVGQIAAFANAVEANETEMAAEALAAKANKAVTTEVVSEVARLAEVEVDEETAQAIAERAAAIQSGESEDMDDTGDDTGGDTGDGTGDGTGSDGSAGGG